MKQLSKHEQNVKNVMAVAKCDEKLARRALRATKGQHYTQAVIYARNEIETLSVPTGKDGTLQGLADSWS